MNHATRLLPLALICLVGALSYLTLFTDDEAPATPPAPPPSLETHDPPVESTPPSLPASTPTTDPTPPTPTPTPPTDAQSPTDTDGHHVTGRIIQYGRPIACAVCAIRLDRRPEREVARTRTDASGALRIALPAGRYRLTFDGRSTPRGFYRHVTVNHARRLGDIVVPPVVRLRGHVVDTDRMPVTGACVYLRFAPDGNPTKPARDPSVAPLAVTDDNGRFTVGRLFAMHYSILIDAPGHPDLHTELPLQDGDRSIRTFRLTRGKQARGRVVDSSGAPVAGARVIPTGDSVTKHNKAVHTDAAGGFVLNGMGIADRFLTVSHPEFQPQKVASSVRMIRLAPAITLRVRVSGAAASACRLKVTLPVDHRDNRAVDSIPGPTWASLDESLAPNEDGEFVVHGLTAGVYDVVAVADGVGASPITEVKLTKDTVVDLAIRPARFMNVWVVDSAGLPLQDATVDWVDDNPKADLITRFVSAAKVHTDDRGLGRLAPPDRDALVRVHCPGYLKATRRLSATSIPSELIVSLRRGGAIEGRIDRPAFLQRYVSEVMAWPWQSDGRIPKQRAAFGPPDASGRFRLDGLKSGRYGVGIYWGDDYYRIDPRRSRPNPGPLLGAGTDPRTVQCVTVEERGTATCTLTVAPFGRIEGRVFSGGRPVPNAIVFGEERKKGDEPRSWRAERLNQYRASTRTSRDGSYSLAFVKPGTYAIYAVLDGAKTVGAPVRVHAIEAGARYACDLKLDCATIVGRVDTRGWSAKKRAHSVFMLPAGDAGRDPFYLTFGFSLDTLEEAPIEVDEAGRFVVEGVPAGEWVVRIKGTLDSMFAQRYVRLRPNERRDLGLIHPRPQAAIDIPLTFPGNGLPRHGYGAWVRRVASATSRIFERTLGVSGGRLETRLAPGAYEVQLFACDGRSAFGLSGSPVGKPKRMIVASDGTVTPPTIRF